MRDLVALLARELGGDSVIVRNEYHAQVKAGDKHHNIYMDGAGAISWRLAGHRGVERGRPGTLVARLKAYGPEKSDVSQMQQALDMAHTVRGLLAKSEEAGIVDGVFCDAGWKPGDARISVVSIQPDEVRAVVRKVQAATSVVAETRAVELAMELYPGRQIYTDCKHVAQRFARLGVSHIPRTENRAADKLANVRGKK